MLKRLTTVYWLVGALAGLTVPAQAAGLSEGSISSVASASEVRAAAARPGSWSGVQLAQNDISVSPQTAAGGEPFPAAVVLPPPVMPSMSQSARIALLLPLQSQGLGVAAAAVRAGFLAAHDRELGSGFTVSVLESGDAAQDILAAYNAAAVAHDIVVGPMSRTGAAAIAQNAQVRKPTIVLTQIDPPGETQLVLPRDMLVIGLSVEQEARQLAEWARANHPGGRAMTIATDANWQTRAASAFRREWQRFGMESQLVELGFAGGYLDANALARLRERIQSSPPDFIFAALSAAQARQLRLAIGREVTVYGTSQLNPVALSDWSVVEPMPELDGVRFVDLPWQLQPEHPVVASYPRMALQDGFVRSADMERLYALGIDAYRVAKELAVQRRQFTIDGLTGEMTVDLDREGERFVRMEVPAVYQNGAVMPLLTAE